MGLFFIACRQFAIKNTGTALVREFLIKAAYDFWSSVDWPQLTQNQVGFYLRNIYTNVYLKLTKGYVVQLSDISVIA